MKNPLRSKLVWMLAWLGSVWVVGVAFARWFGHEVEVDRLDVGRVVAASRAYANLLESRNESIPVTVSAGELVREGLLNRDQMSLFGGAELFVGLRVDETRPQSIIAEARIPGGARLVLLGDGSVQPWAAWR